MALKDIDDASFEVALFYKVDKEELEDLILRLAREDPRADNPFFDMPIDLEELREQLPDIKRFVDNFLSVSDVPTPTIREFSPLSNWEDFTRVAPFYIVGFGSMGIGLGTALAGGVNWFNFYATTMGAVFFYLANSNNKSHQSIIAFYSNGALVLNKQTHTKTKGPLTLVHEYTHAVQDAKDMLGPHTKSFQEGMAITLEAEFADQKKKEGEPNYKVFSHHNDLFYLRNAYKRMCSYKTIETHPEVLGNELTGFANWHEIGRTIFAIAEARHGRENVLRKAMALEQFW